MALAGGGSLGAIHEIGALCALDESLSGIDFTPLHHHVGASGYAGWRQMTEHARQRTRAMLLARQAVLTPRLARHGIAVRLDVLDELARTARQFA